MVSHRRPTQSGPGIGARVSAVTVVSAAAATAAATLGASPAGAEPQRRPEVTRATVDQLFADAEKATERYNSADERARKLRGLVEQAQDRAARGQEAVNKMRGALGSLALAQYRSGGLDPALSLLLSSDPDSYLDRAAVLERVGVRQSGALRELEQAQRTLGRVRSEAARDLTELERSRAAVARHKRAVEGKLAEARRVLATLPTTERAGLRALLALGPRRDGEPALRRPRWRGLLGAGRRRRARRPERGGAALRVGRQRALRLRLFGADPVVVRTGGRRAAAHLPGPAVRGPAGPALPGAPR